ncbi:endonuclease III [Magnetococcales bacterium HHB-1]
MVQHYAPLDPEIVPILEALKKQNANPKSELQYRNSFELLVAVVLSAQSTDKGVNKATPALFAVAPTPEKMVELGVDGIKTHIRTIGLYNNKAKNLFLLSQQLIEKHQSQVPTERKALEALAGVGRKTANVVLNVAFKQPTMAVDTHVFRVSKRIGLAKGKTPLTVEKDLLAVIPEQYMDHGHHYLIFHGRYVCKAKNPLCDQCVVSAWCRFPEEKGLSAKK